jgi:hypothetical protein
METLSLVSSVLYCSMEAFSFVTSVLQYGNLQLCQFYIIEVFTSALFHQCLMGAFCFVDQNVIWKPSALSHQFCTMEAFRFVKLVLYYGSHQLCLISYVLSKPSALSHQFCTMEAISFVSSVL